MKTLRQTGQRPGRSQLVARVATAIGLAGIVAALAACGSDPSTAPTSRSTLLAQREWQAPSLASNVVSRLGDLIPVVGILREKPLLQDVVVTKTISSGGGTIDVPGTDFKLVIPKDAFPEKSLTFTVRAYAGLAVAYDFQPHGRTWLKPLEAQQDLNHTNLHGVKLPKGFYPDWSGAYFADPSQVNMLTGDALVNELESTGMSVDGSRVSWTVPHFSGYIVSWGRQ